GDDFIQLGMATADPSRRPTPGSFGFAGGEALEAVFVKALAVKPQERFATAGEFWQAVRRSQNMPGMQMSDPNPQSWGSPSGSGARTDPSKSGQTPPHLAHLGSAATELYPAASQSVASQVVSQGPSTRDPVASPASPAPARSKGGLVAGIAIGAIVVGGAGFFLMNKGTGDKAAPAPSATAAAAAPVASAPPAPKECPPKMARVEGGKFFQGSDEKDADPDERPAHQVTLAPYCIDLYEVTAGEYKAC